MYELNNISMEVVPKAFSYVGLDDSFTPCKRQAIIWQTQW